MPNVPKNQGAISGSTKITMIKFLFPIYVTYKIIEFSVVVYLLYLGFNFLYKWHQELEIMKLWAQ